MLGRVVFLLFLHRLERQEGSDGSGARHRHLWQRISGGILNSDPKYSALLAEACKVSIRHCFIIKAY